MHARTAAAIKKHRAGRSAQEIADRTAELGYPISRAQIANYESGRKKNLDVAELLILAAALDVPPLLLLYPDLPDGTVEITPRHTGTSWTAHMWATGAAPSFMNRSGTPSHGEQLVNAVRERSELIREAARLHINAGLYGYDKKLKRSFESNRAEVTAKIRQLDAVINELGGTVNNA